VPGAGSPVNITLAVETLHVGWIIVSISGTVGTEEAGRMTISAVGSEVHPDAFVTV
jgi:hypothetical protein